MLFKHFVFLIFVLGISLHNVIGQLDVINPIHPQNTPNDPNTQLEEDPGTVEVDADEPENDDDVMVRLNQVDSLDEFLHLLQRDGHQVTENDIFDELVDEDGKQQISGGGRLAAPDNCSPRNTTIRITMEGTDSDVAFFPRCTKIERCGGCCSSPHLDCRPLYTERVSLKVLKGRVPFPGAAYLDYTGFAPVIVDRHMTCRVVCTLTADKCGTKKRFMRQACTCRCKRTLACAPPTFWDADDCSCKCPRILDCCPGSSNCGMVFNPSTCDCELASDERMHISIADGNHTQIHAGSGTVGSHDTPAPSTAAPTPATTTTTTTTTSSTTDFDPCLTQVCHHRFTKVRRGNNCFCQPPFNRRRPRPRG